MQLVGLLLPQGCLKHDRINSTGLRSLNAAGNQAGNGHIQIGGDQPNGTILGIK